LGGYFGAMKTPGGYVVGDVTSALQKEIRRGNEREALFWATELELAGFAGYVWRRLQIIASEDVGVGEPMAVVQLRALFDTWTERVKKEKAAAKSGRPIPPESRLFLIHGVQVMARARKSRMADHAYMVMYERDRAELGMEIPDYALDKHTARGRKMGRGVQHFVDVSSRLENEAPIDDPYREEGTKAFLAYFGDEPERPDGGGPWGLEAEEEQETLESTLTSSATRTAR
jgi:hypothetical protein